MKASKGNMEIPKHDLFSFCIVLAFLFIVASFVIMQLINQQENYRRHVSQLNKELAECQHGYLPR